MPRDAGRRGQRVLPGLAVLRHAPTRNACAASGVPRICQVSSMKARSSTETSTAAGWPCRVIATRSWCARPRRPTPGTGHGPHRVGAALIPFSWGPVGNVLGAPAGRPGCSGGWWMVRRRNGVRGQGASWVELQDSLRRSMPSWATVARSRPSEANIEPVARPRPPCADGDCWV